MPSDVDWANAFLEQARADLEVARSVAGTELTVARASVLAMLLQMAFEKLAKAALLRSRATTYAAVSTSHRAASRMVLAMRVQKKLLVAIGGPWPWAGAFAVIEELERSHPALAQGAAQLEYPWEAAGVVRWPARDLPIAQRLASPKSTLLRHVLEFACQLDRHFDRVFPP